VCRRLAQGALSLSLSPLSFSQSHLRMQEFVLLTIYFASFICLCALVCLYFSGCQEMTYKHDGKDVGGGGGGGGGCVCRGHCEKRGDTDRGETKDLCRRGVDVSPLLSSGMCLERQGCVPSMYWISLFYSMLIT